MRNSTILRTAPFTIILLAALAVANCQAGVKQIPVEPDSELGKKIKVMDAEGRAFQNAPAFSKAIQKYEVAHGGSCTNVVFDRLQEPGQKIGQYVSLYTMEGISSDCGKRTYQTRITFRDVPHTVAKRVEILLGPKDESDFREKAMEFIRYAQAGQVDKMLEITSKLSHATGTDSIRSLYADQVIPQFFGVSVTWDPLSTPSIDEQNNVGIIFTGTASGTNNSSFDVVVYKENGKLVVANIQKHQ